MRTSAVQDLLKPEMSKVFRICLEVLRNKVQTNHSMSKQFKVFFWVCSKVFNSKGISEVILFSIRVQCINRMENGLQYRHPGWKPIANHRWSPMIHRSPTGGPLRWIRSFCGGHWWSTDKSTGGPPINPPVVTECCIGGHRWKLINTPLATDGSTGNKSVTIPKWYPSSVILGLIPSKYMVLDIILSGKSL